MLDDSLEFSFFLVTWVTARDSRQERLEDVDDWLEESEVEGAANFRNRVVDTIEEGADFLLLISRNHSSETRQSSAFEIRASVVTSAVRGDVTSAEHHSFSTAFSEGILSSAVTEVVSTMVGEYRTPLELGRSLFIELLDERFKTELFGVCLLLVAEPLREESGVCGAFLDDGLDGFNKGGINKLLLSEACLRSNLGGDSNPSDFWVGRREPKTVRSERAELEDAECTPIQHGGCMSEFVEISESERMLCGELDLVKLVELTESFTSDSADDAGHVGAVVAARAEAHSESVLVRRRQLFATILDAVQELEGTENRVTTGIVDSCCDVFISEVPVETIMVPVVPSLDDTIFVRGVLLLRAVLDGSKKEICFS